MPIHGNPPARITISEIVAEFGGSPPHGLSEYYRGGAFVLNSPLNTNISSSLNLIRLSQFYGASKFFLKAKFSSTSETFQQTTDQYGNVLSSGANNNATVTVTVEGTSNNFEIRHLIDNSTFGSVDTTNFTPITIGGIDSESTVIILIRDKSNNNVFKFTFNPGYSSEASVISRNGSAITQGVWFSLPIGSTDVATPIPARLSIVSQEGYCTTYNDGVGGTFVEVPPEGQVIQEYGCDCYSDYRDDGEYSVCNCSGLCHSGCDAVSCQYSTASGPIYRDYPSG